MSTIELRCRYCGDTITQDAGGFWRDSTPDPGDGGGGDTTCGMSPAYFIGKDYGEALHVPDRDRYALDQIAHWLRDPEWGVGMLEDIAETVAATGRDLAGSTVSTWVRH